MAAGQVDDGQSAHAHGALPIGVSPLVVRAAMARDPPHGVEQSGVSRIAVKIYDSVYAAHSSFVTRYGNL